MAQEESKEAKPTDNQELIEETKADVEQMQDTGVQVPVADMDGRVLEAFYRSLLESVKDTDLPLEPSDYLRNYFYEYVCDEFQLNLKQSSFKKIGKLLENASRDGVINYEMTKGKSDHKVITVIHRQHEL